MVQNKKFKPIHQHIFGKGVCKGCDSTFTKKRRSQIYCSHRCMRAYRKSRIPSHKQWLCLVEYCKERENYKCAKCSETNNLCCHHIKPLTLGGNNDYNNLIILCDQCHGAAHQAISKQLQSRPS